MDDVRRFLRYILPGIAYAIQLLIALCISDWKNFPEFIKINGTKGSISLLLVGLLASGGLGYIFSIIYYGLYWFAPISNKIAINHIIVFQTLDEFIEIRDAKGNIIPTSSLSKKKAWAILTQYWFTKYKDKSCLRGSNIIIDRMSNIVHGIGTTIVATFLSIISWFIIHYHLSSDTNFFSFLSPIGIIIFVACWLLFLILLFSNYLQATKFYQSLINSSLVEVVMNEYDIEKKEKVIIWFSE